MPDRKTTSTIEITKDQLSLIKEESERTGKKVWYILNRIVAAHYKNKQKENQDISFEVIDK